VHVFVVLQMVQHLLDFQFSQEEGLAPTQQVQVLKF
jgi:hypothetical protein